MIRLLLTYELITFAFVYLILGLKNTISKIKNGEIHSGIVQIILDIAVLVFTPKNISLLNFTFNIIVSKTIFIGILNFIFSIIDGINLEYWITFAIVTGIICIGTYFVGFTGINNIVFNDIPTKVERHYDSLETKKHAKKLNPETELKEILAVLDEKEINYSKESINKEISNRGYRGYNGIYCYYFEEKEEYYEIDMTIGENAFFFQSKDMSKPFNFRVNKNTLSIVQH